MFTTAADRLVAATKSSQTPLRWLLGMRRIPVLDWRERLVCFWRGSQQVDMAVSGRRSGGSATPSTRTASPEPEPKRQTITAPSASNRALPGFKCRQ
jgi:hypothetical protein